jgi:hypothetical protein
MLSHEEFFRHPGWGEITRQIKFEIAQAQRPANEIILDDVDLCAILKVSKRTTATLRATKQISYSDCGKIKYLLSDVLDYINRNRIEADFDVIKSRFK